MATALILGANGQDGSYLADLLVKRGHRVIGIGRHSRSAYDRPSELFRYVSLDLRDNDALGRVLDEERPDLAFHFAAVHGAIGAGFSYEAIWHEVMQVNVLALHRVLEHARTRNPGMRVVYAGSAKVFPLPWRGRLDVHSPMQPTCLYGISKLTARDLMRHYKDEHGIDSTNVILFNHDSPRRPPQYFLPRVAAALVAARRGATEPTVLNSLDFNLDWSAADEIMDMIIDIALGPPIAEILVASGRTENARDLVSRIFNANGFDPTAHVRSNAPPQDAGAHFEVDIEPLVSWTGRSPRKTADAIVMEIAADMERAQR